jgi:L-alanine-DL-glutamate epimerase-like enolase superfamily enzyme
MDRRTFLSSLAAGAGSALPLALFPQVADAALSDLKITGIRIFNPTNDTGLSGWLNQSEIIVAVDTDAGITGFGQGGTRDVLRDAAGVLIGKDPFRTEYLWQRMYRSTFYPPGREKLHAIGALDCALWDIKGKAADLPVYEMLGGRARDHVECYSTRGTLTREAARGEARRAMAEGFRAIRFHGVEAENGVFDARRAVEHTAAICAELREGVGPNGEFILDAHTRFDFADALRLIELITPLKPLFVEDPLRTIDDATLFAVLRGRVSVPLAAGEQFGDLRDGSLPFVEQGLIDYLRASIPNVGGITGFKKIAALCEAHSVGLVPHFTAPISTAAVIHALTAFPGPALNEVLRSALPDYLSEAADFRDGKLWPNDRPGLGVILDESKVNLVDTLTEPRSDGLYQGESYHRPDGSYLYL